MTKRELKYLVNVITLLAIVLVYFGARCLPVGRQACQTDPVQGKGSVCVARAIDGDTLKLSDGERVRLIGIDTPESRYNSKLERDVSRSKKDMKTVLRMGKEAASFTKRLAEGKAVRLEFDVQKRDKYGRLLAYVYLNDGTFVNAKVIEEGYAQVMTIPPNVKYADLFLKLQREAVKNNKGLWKDAAGQRLF